MEPGLERGLKVYAVAVLSLLLALGLRLALDPWLDSFAPFMVFVIAVTISAWYGGFLVGVLVTLAGAALGNFFFTEPEYSLGVASPTELVQSLVFVFEGLLFSILSGSRLAALVRLTQTAAALRSLASELTVTEERQRRDLAQELHDQLQQLLVACRMKLGTLQRAADPERTRRLAQEVDDLLHESIQYTRVLTTQLSPPVLHQKGLQAALKWLAPQFQERFGLKVDVEGTDDAETAREDVRVLMFQAVRELLFNTAKHAATDQARIRVHRENERLLVTVEDQGKGFDPAKVARRPGGAGGLGLFSIQERLRSLGGHMDIRSAPGQGTRTTLMAPVS